MKRDRLTPPLPPGHRSIRTRGGWLLGTYPLDEALAAAKATFAPEAAGAAGHERSAEAPSCCHCHCPRSEKR